jgi:lipoate-protein ligase B
MTLPPLAVLRLGRVPYTAALELQRALSEERIAGRTGDLLLLLEHEPTITLGRGTKASSLPIDPEILAQSGLTVAEVDRGGDVTWHGPGQLVGYPILDLNSHRPDLHWYLRQVEEAVIGGLGLLGLHADRNPGFTGVWTGGRKIASIGIHVRQWVTTHGFAINVSNALDDFQLIVPCGIAGVQMTTVTRELPAAPADLWEAAELAVSESFGRAFKRETVPAPPLDQLLGGAVVRE